MEKSAVCSNRPLKRHSRRRRARPRASFSRALADSRIIASAFLPLRRGGPLSGSWISRKWDPVTGTGRSGRARRRTRPRRTRGVSTTRSRSGDLIGSEWPWPTLAPRRFVPIDCRTAGRGEDKAERHANVFGRGRLRMMRMRSCGSAGRGASQFRPRRTGSTTAAAVPVRAASIAGRAPDVPLHGLRRPVRAAAAFTVFGFPPALGAVRRRVHPRQAAGSGRCGVGGGGRAFQSGMDAKKGGRPARGRPPVGGVRLVASGAGGVFNRPPGLLGSHVPSGTADRGATVAAAEPRTGGGRVRTDAAFRARNRRSSVVVSAG